MPILKGIFTNDTSNTSNTSNTGSSGSSGSSIKITGLWSMLHHDKDFVGQTANFEYITTINNDNNDDIDSISITQSNDSSFRIPLNGMYSGYFSLICPDNSIIKVNESDINIIIDKDSNTISGSGQNQYGNFGINGTVSLDGSIILFKEYIPSVKTTRKRSIAAIETPRELPSRIRKPSSLIKMYEEEEAVPIVRYSSEKKQSNNTDTKKNNNNHSNTSDRTPKSSNSNSNATNIIMNNCLELLKDVMKHPSAVYFLEPVDYVKLEIPDYPIRIKHPMDFGTILKKFNSKKYDVDNFASDVRLIIKNALKYNNKPEHFVHIAAKELSVYFEDLFRPIFAAYTLDITDIDAYQSKVNRPITLQQPENNSDHIIKSNHNDPGPRQNNNRLGQTIEENIESIKVMRSKLDKFETKLTFIDAPNNHDDIIVTDGIIDQISKFDNAAKKILINIMKNETVQDSNEMEIDYENSISLLYNNSDNYTKQLISSSFCN